MFNRLDGFCFSVDCRVVCWCISGSIPHWLVCINICIILYRPHTTATKYNHDLTGKKQCILNQAIHVDLDWRNNKHESAFVVVEG